MQGELGLDAIAGIGWCFGGRVALVHGGSDDRLSAVAAYNPTVWSDATVETRGSRRGSRPVVPGGAAAFRGGQGHPPTRRVRGDQAVRCAARRGMS
jgi:dienelactone hydrolase